MSSQRDGKFTKGTALDKIMNTLSQYPGVWFTSSTIAKTTGINYNTVRPIIMILKKYDCIISSSMVSDKETIFSIDGDSLSRYYARIKQA